MLIFRLNFKLIFRLNFKLHFKLIFKLIFKFEVDHLSSSDCILSINVYLVRECAEVGAVIRTGVGEIGNLVKSSVVLCVNVGCKVRMYTFLCGGGKRQCSLGKCKVA